LTVAQINKRRHSEPFDELLQAKTFGTIPSTVRFTGSEDEFDLEMNLRDEDIEGSSDEYHPHPTENVDRHYEREESHLYEDDLSEPGHHIEPQEGSDIYEDIEPSPEYSRQKIVLIY
jgi:hypothetical protein